MIGQDKSQGISKEQLCFSISASTFNPVSQKALKKLIFLRINQVLKNFTCPQAKSKNGLQIFIFRMVKITQSLKKKASRENIYCLNKSLFKSSQLFSGTILQETLRKLRELLQTLLRSYDHQTLSLIQGVKPPYDGSALMGKPYCSFSCLGCIGYFHQNHDYQFSQSSNDYIVMETQSLKESSNLVKGLCAALNSGRAYIFLVSSAQKLQGKTKIMGLSKEDNDKLNVQEMINNCLSFIQPNPSGVQKIVQHIPIMSTGNAKIVGCSWITRIRILAHQSEHLFYNIYKQSNSHKKYEVQSYEISNATIVPVARQKIYIKICLRYCRNKGSKPHWTHQPINCQKIDYEPITTEETNKIQPNLNSWPLNSYKYVTVIRVLPQKKGDSVQKIKSMLAESKILYELCRVENVSNSKTKNKYLFELLLFNCPTESVNRILSNCNKEGELVFAQAFLNLVLKDSEFFSSNRIQNFTNFMSTKLSSCDYTISNTFKGTLDLTSKESIILKFKNLEHSILAYCWLSAEGINRLQFKM